jgi:hypothetical protein
MLPSPAHPLCSKRNINAPKTCQMAQERESFTVKSFFSTLFHLASVLLLEHGQNFQMSSFCEVKSDPGPSVKGGGKGAIWERVSTCSILLLCFFLNTVRTFKCRPFSEVESDLGGQEGRLGES